MAAARRRVAAIRADFGKVMSCQTVPVTLACRSAHLRTNDPPRTVPPRRCRSTVGHDRVPCLRGSDALRWLAEQGQREVADGWIVTIEEQTRCTGKSFLPIFLASFVAPSLALQLRREADDRSL